MVYTLKGYKGPYTRAKNKTAKMKFSQVIGHEELKERLRKNIDEGRVSHAQLFVGEHGWGTLQLALAYVQYLHCSNRSGGEPCGVCPSCVQMQSLAHPDVHFVYPTIKPKGSSTPPTSDLYIEQWREVVADNEACFSEHTWYEAIGADNAQGLITTKEADEIIRKLSYKAFEGTHKSVVVWMPEKMHTAAANALLKILEEPWENTLFLLVSEHPEVLLDTIISRTQSVNVGRIEQEALRSYATRTLGATEEQAEVAARLADGSVLNLRRIVAEGGSAAATDNFELFTRLMRLSYGNKHLDLFEWAEQVAAMGRENQKSFLEYALRLIRESYMLPAGMESVSYLWGDEKAFCSKFAPYVANHNVEALVAEIERALRDVGQNGNAKIVFTHFALAVSKLIAMRA